VVCVAGDGDFLMNGQELATAAQYRAKLLVIVADNSSYGTIRMHQERDYPERVSGTDLRNPDFAALARAHGGWAATVERTEDFAPALDEALARDGIRLLHCKTDVEQITNQMTISKLREKAKA
jgi:acetolactate synthase-1/2/3 large subunit